MNFRYVVRIMRVETEMVDCRSLFNEVLSM